MASDRVMADDNSSDNKNAGAGGGPASRPDGRMAQGYVRQPMIVEWARQTRALLEKNALLVFLRRPLIATMVLLFPVAVIVLLTTATRPWDKLAGVYEVDLTQSSSASDPISYGWPAKLTCREHESRPGEGYDDRTCTSPIVYAPATSENNAIMKSVGGEFGYEMGTDIIAYADVTALMKAIFDPTQQLFIGGGIIFSTDPLDPEGDTKRVTSFINGTVGFGSDGDLLRFPLVAQLYIENLASDDQPVLQASIASIPDITRLEDLNPEYDGFRSSAVTNTQNIIFPVLLTMAFFPLLLASTRFVASEREAGLVAPLKRLGLQESAYLTANFTILMLLNIVASALATATAKITSPWIDQFGHTSSTILFLVFLMYGMSMIAFGLFVAVLPWPRVQNYFLGVVMVGALIFVLLYTIISEVTSNSATLAPSLWNSAFAPGNTAQAVGLSFMPWFILGKILDDISLQTTKDTVLDPTTNITQLALGNYTLSELYTTHPPEMLFTSVSSAPDGSSATKQVKYTAPSTGASLADLFWISLFYLFLSWYIGQVLPGKTGIAQPVYFPFSPTYWRGFVARDDYIAEGDTLAQLQKKSAMERSINLYKISKVYERTTAVRELSISMVPGQITALLGQNGAGKSTTINMITGLTGPSSGTGFVCGMDLATESGGIQNLMPDHFGQHCCRLGSCPQDDFLWQELSPSEHMKLYLAFRPQPALSTLNNDEYIQEALEKVSLWRVNKKAVGGFSGGMKRRLSLCLSILGDPAIVVLDEPTTGLDPINRRRVWLVIEKLKKSRVVVLTTHSMEEADHLADRVCIMHRGQLKADGSSSFLKRRFGKDFEMVLMSRGETQAALEAFTQQLLPGCEIVSSASGRLQVAVDRSQAHHLPRFFRMVKDANMNGSSGVHRECSISKTTLEQVFIKLCQLNADVAIQIVAQGDGNDMGSVEEAAAGIKRCCICGVRATDTVTLYTKAGVGIQATDLVCEPCALGESVEVDAVRSIETEAVDAKPALEDNISLTQHNDVPPPAVAPPAVSAPLRRNTLAGSDLLMSQYKAVLIKNTQILKRRKNFNICVLLTALGLLLTVGLVNDGRSDLELTDYYCPYGDPADGIYFYKGGFDTESCDVEEIALRAVQQFANGDLAYQAYYNNDFSVLSQDHSGGGRGGGREEISPGGSIDGKVKIWLQIGDGVNETLARQLFPSSAFDLEVKSSIVSSFSSIQESTRTTAQAAAAAADGELCPLITQRWKKVYPVIAPFRESVEIPSDAAVSDDYVDDSVYHVIQARWRQRFADFGVHVRSLGDGDIRYTVYQYNTTLFSQWQPASISNVWSSAYYDLENDDDSNFCRSIRVGPDISGIGNNVVRSIRDGFLSGWNTSLARSTVQEYTIDRGRISFHWISNQQAAITTIILICFTLPFETALLLLVGAHILVMERSDRLMFMMKLQGMSPTIYWIANLTFIYLSSFIMFVIYLLVLYVLKPLVVSTAHTTLLIVLLLLWPWVLACSVVLLSGFFSRPGLAGLCVLVLAGIGAIACMIVHLGEIDRLWYVYALPPMILGRIVPEIFENDEVNLAAKDMGIMFAISIIYLFVGIGLHNIGMIWSMLRRSMSPKAQQVLQPEDEETADPDAIQDQDVASERERLQRHARETKDPTLAIAIVGLDKVYADGKHAVNDLYLGVEYGESLALLGPNGSGKSTTVSMLSGLIDPSCGSAWVAGQSIGESGISVGICPQFDTIWSMLSVRQTIAFYARIRGSPPRDVNGWVQAAAENVELDGDPFDNPAGNLSGGQRRRLSIAIALVGSPLVVLMDEPSTGIDAETRNKIWKVLEREKGEGRCMLLTTHSMEEADALATRVAIVAQGKLRCVGSQARLKKRFGHGYTLTLQVEVIAAGSDIVHSIEKTAVGTVDQFVKKNVSSTAIAVHENKATLNVAKKNIMKNAVSGAIECHWKVTRIYLVSGDDLDFEHIFTSMQGEARKIGVFSWCIAEPSLDDVFVKVAGDYMDED